MTDVPTHPTGGSGRYAIRVRGHLHQRWVVRFDGFSLTDGSDGTTVLAGRADQAGLHGVLRTLADIGLPLVSVTTLAAEEPSTTAEPTTSTTDPS
jgi:hypothetical protein